MRSLRIGSLVSIAFVCALAGCGDDPPRHGQLPYSADQTTVIGAGGSNAADGGLFGNPAASGGIAVGTGSGDVKCESLGGDVCEVIPDACNEGDAKDVLVDDKGNVLYTACYPTTGVSVEDFEGPVGDLPNNSVLVLDNTKDGVDVMGDVTIDGNNITVYGGGPDVSVIGGDLNIAKNNSVVRGVRIQGDVEISKNNGTLIDCVIEGNLTITGENVNVALCEVWGTTTVSANNAVLVQDSFASEPVIDAKPKACVSDVLFVDANMNKVIEDTEVGMSFTCDDGASGGGGKPGKP